MTVVVFVCRASGTGTLLAHESHDESPPAVRFDSHDGASHSF